MSGESSLLSRIPRKWLFLALFLFLVFLSNTWRKTHPYSDPVPADATVVEVREFAKNRPADPTEKPVMAPTGDHLKVALRDYAADRPGAPTVLVIHGTPGAADTVEPLVKSLRGTHRLLVPDLPGFGASTPDLDNYGIEAQAHALLDLIKAQKLQSVHILAVGQGGGTALNLAHLAPEKVKSLALVSSIGAQEYDLMGNPVVNLIVYTYNLGLFKLWQDATPHFGLLDRIEPNKNCARVLWDSNLANLKEYARAYRGPLLLAHGKDDWCVAPDTAYYTKQIAPQAETLFVPGGHRVFLTEAAAHAPKFADFFARAEAGAAPLATHPATTENLPKAPSATGAHYWVLMLIILACTLVAEDPTCLATGLLVAAGLIDFWSGTAACLVGIFIGDLFLYSVGFVLGRKALRKAPLKWLISEYEVNRMSTRFGSTQGMMVIVTSRFIPGSRVPTFVAAGIMKLHPVKLGMLFFIAAALWTPPLVWIAERTGGGVMEKFQELHHLAGFIAIGLLVGIFVVFHFIVPAFTWMGRRQLHAKARRWTNHASMPAWRLALPGFFHTIALGLKHRALARPAAANPGLGRLGGAAGESKSALLAPFAHHPLVAPHATLTAGDAHANAAKLASFVRNARLAYPLVLKPDAAENGAGVAIVATEEDALKWLSGYTGPALAQPFVPGREYELVWSRAPKADAGHLLAVVEKRRVTIQGDGHHTLERLIWASDAALDHADLFVRLNAGKEDSIPAAGEIVTLCDLGSVALGAHVSVRHGLADAPGANAAVNALVAGIPGVTWLRLDVRAESDEAFAAGRFTVTEIEGAGRLSSALRDPDMRQADIQLLLAKQRAAAFAAGTAMLAADPAARRPAWVDLLATRGEAAEIRGPNPV